MSAPTRPDKRMAARAIVAQLRDGMTIGIGGWGPRRKPMALVREILRSPLKDLTIVAYGGADVGMLCAAGKVKKLVFAFVSLDAIPLEPWFRKAREAGQIAVLELDEGMLQWGLKAAAFGLPFLPTRVGLGTDLAALGGLKTVTSPYGDGEVLIAMPALKLRAKSTLALAEGALFLFESRPLAYSDAARALLDDAGLDLLAKVINVLQECPEWAEAALESAVKGVAEEVAVGLGKVAQPLRAA